MNFCIKVLFILVVFLLCQTSFAQQALFNLEADDTLPIASQRFDDAVEPPKNNFSSVAGQDMWEKFERGDLDEKGYVELQKQYSALVAKNPELSKKFAARKAKEDKKRALASLKKDGKSKKDSKEIVTKDPTAQVVSTKNLKKRIPQSLPKKLPAKKK